MNIFFELDKLLLSRNGQIIHQIWFDNIAKTKRASRKAFQKYEKHRQSWITKNPNWHYRLWSKEEAAFLISFFYPEFFDLYKGYKYEIQRCDAVRYFILHRYGGIYADMDTECFKTLDEILTVYPKDINILETAGNLNNRYATNSLMYSVPQHIFWKKVFIELEKAKDTPWYYTRHHMIISTAGPLFLDRVYTTYKYKYNIGMFPMEKFNPVCVGGTDPLNIDKSKIYVMHYGAGSWETLDSKILVMIGKNLLMVTFIILVILIPSLIYGIVISLLKPSTNS